MFRKIYWVTEKLESHGASQVLGVYTSIPELIRRGLNGHTQGQKLRLTLCKLDSEQQPLGAWSEPDFTDIRDALQEYVQTEEISSDHREMLVQALEERVGVAA